jgi:NitT/TauT family transport system ATP-binding protein
MADLEPLPATGISKILTLCEVLSQHGGEEGLFALTHDLHVPFAEALQVVKSGEMLQLVTTPDQRVELTPLGQEVYAADPTEKKRLLKAQVLRLHIFRHLVQLLNNAASRSVPADVIVEELALRLPQEPPRQLFTTLLNWGRYCDLFGFSHDTNLLTLVAD